MQQQIHNSLSDWLDRKTHCIILRPSTTVWKCVNLLTRNQKTVNTNNLFYSQGMDSMFALFNWLLNLIFKLLPGQLRQQRRTDIVWLRRCSLAVTALTCPSLTRWTQAPWPSMTCTLPPLTRKKISLSGAYELINYVIDQLKKQLSGRHSSVFWYIITALLRLSFDRQNIGYVWNLYMCIRKEGRKEMFGYICIMKETRKCFI